MSKTKEELNELKNEYETLNSKLEELSEDELMLVVGGTNNQTKFDEAKKQIIELIPIIDAVYAGNSRNANVMDLHGMVHSLYVEDDISRFIEKANEAYGLAKNIVNNFLASNVTGDIVAVKIRLELVVDILNGIV